MASPHTTRRSRLRAAVVAGVMLAASVMIFAPGAVRAAPGDFTQVGDAIVGEAAGDAQAASALSADGSVIAVGAPLHDGNGNDAGRVRIFENASGTWTPVGDPIDGEAAGDVSGATVALSDDGSIVAIGAPLNGAGGFMAGHVRIFGNVGGTWTQIGEDIDGGAADETSGSALALSSDGSIVAIGSPDAFTGDSPGLVRVYQNTAGTWTQVGADIDGDAARDYFGRTVALSSDGATVAIGGNGNDGNGNDAGHVRVLENVGGTWTKVGADIVGEAAGDFFGTRVSLSSDGATVAAGAQFHDGANGSDSGHVRVFANSGGTWTQVGDAIDGEASDDNAAGANLSGDASTLAIGAPGNDDGGDAAGHVRVFENNGGTWTQIGTDFDGEAAEDTAGFVSPLSRDGSTLAIGATGNDDGGDGAGHVRVYSRSVDGAGAVDADDDGSSVPDDCDDTDPATYPGAPPLADDVDRDCSGTVEADEQTTPRERTFEFDPATGELRFDPTEGFGGELVDFDPTSAEGGTIKEGSLIYTPPAGFSGTDSFSYRLDIDGKVFEIGVTVDVEGAAAPSAQPTAAPAATPVRAQPAFTG